MVNVARIKPFHDRKVVPEGAPDIDLGELDVDHEDPRALYSAEEAAADQMQKLKNLEQWREKQSLRTITKDTAVIDKQGEKFRKMVDPSATYSSEPAEKINDPDYIPDKVKEMDLVKLGDIGVDKGKDSMINQDVEFDEVVTNFGPQESKPSTSCHTTLSPSITETPIQDDMSDQQKTNEAASTPQLSPAAKFPEPTLTELVTKGLTKFAPIL